MAGNEANIEHQRDWSDARGNPLEDSAVVDRLVARGASRLTAERIVAIERGRAEPGRARRRPQSRH